LAKADAIAALVVAIIVIYVSLQLGRRAVAVLLDAAPPGLVERIAAEASRVPGVEAAGPVRARQAGASTFVDLTVHVDRSASLEEAHQIAAAVEVRVGGLLHQGDVVVHVDPEQRRDESLPQTVGAIAAQQGLRVHNIHAHELKGRYFVDLHAEVPPDLTLDEAHERINHLEASIREEMPHVSSVSTHIEPRAVPVIPGLDEMQTDPALQAQIAVVIEGVAGLHGCHQVEVRAAPDGYDIVLHCLADPDLPIMEAHRLSELAESQLRAEVPGIAQVLVHIEPQPPA
jgi:divalent metal cation (Fe/Co/Zn/Cd) transporter